MPPDKQGEDQRVEMETGSRRWPRDGLEHQNKRASSKVLGSLLWCGVRVCVCVHAHSEVSGRERVGKRGLGVFFPHSAVRSRSTSKGGRTGMQ